MKRTSIAFGSSKQPVVRSLIGKLLVGGLFGLLYVLGLGWALLHRPNQEPTRRLEFWSIDKPDFIAAGSRVMLVPLAKAPSPSGRFRHSLDFQGIATHPESQLFSNAITIGFHLERILENNPERRRVGGTVSLANARWVNLDDPSIEFTLNGPTRFKSGGLLELRRKGSENRGATILAAEKTPPPVSRWLLELDLVSDIDLALRCHVATGRQLGDFARNPVGIFAHTAPAQRGQDPALSNFCFPHGRFSLPRPTPGGGEARWELLAHLWQFEHPALAVGWRISVGVLLLSLGAAILPWSWFKFRPNTKQAQEGNESSLSAWIRRKALLSASIGGALVWAAFSFTQSWLTPPFYGVDELAHFFSHCTWTGDLRLREDGWNLGKTGHHSRLWMRPDQKFTSIDRNLPLDYFIDNPATMDTQPEARSAVAARLWRWTDRWTRTTQAATTLARLRLLNVAVTSIAFGVFVFLCSVGRSSTAALPASPFLLLAVPSLSYFSMNHSNYPLILAAGLVLAGGCVALLRLPTAPVWLGAVLGITLGVALHTSVAGLPLIVFAAGWFLALPFRSFFTFQFDHSSNQVRILQFWGLFVLGLLFSRILSNPAFDARVLESWKSVADRFHLGGLGRAPFALWALTIVVVLAALEQLCFAVGRSQWGRDAQRWAERQARWAWIAPGLIAGTWFLIQLQPMVELGGLRETVPMWDFPRGTGIPRPTLSEAGQMESNPARSAYVLHALQNIFRSFGPTGGDFMVGRLFWGSIGYVDTWLPDFWVRIVVTTFWVGLGLLFWRCAVKQNAWRLFQVSALLAALIAYATVYTLACHLSVAKPSLHGRYLTVFYTVLMAVCAMGWEGVMRRLATGNLGWTALVVLGPAMLLQGAAAMVALGRYF